MSVKQRSKEVLSMPSTPEILYRLQDISGVILPAPISRSTGNHAHNVGLRYSNECGFKIIKGKMDGMCFIDNMKRYVEFTQKFPKNNFYLFLCQARDGDDPKPFSHLAIVLQNNRKTTYIDVSNGSIEMYDMSIRVNEWENYHSTFEWGLLSLDSKILDLFKVKRSAVDYDKLCFHVSSLCYAGWVRHIL